MKKRTQILTLLLLISFGVNAQNSKDRKSIKEMCGCFEVTFNFSETFNYSEDSLYKPSKMKNETALEWAGLIVDRKNKVSIQHILQVGEPERPYMVKHWRQDWMYQNTGFYMYDFDNKWKYETKSKAEVKGQWTQKVYQVDDSPRYEGSGSWVHIDGKSYWENTTNAPLPRREYTKRNDYNMTLRRNRHEITKEGWVHDQYNDKVIKTDGQPAKVLAQEKGYNTYVKVDDSKCKAAADWWAIHQNKWALVSSKWDEVYGRNTDLTLAEKVDNKALYKHLFSDDYTEKKAIDNVIDSFIK
jgi:hypothetical protein